VRREGGTSGGRRYGSLTDRAIAVLMPLASLPIDERVNPWHLLSPTWRSGSTRSWSGSSLTPPTTQPASGRGRYCDLESVASHTGERLVRVGTMVRPDAFTAISQDQLSAFRTSSGMKMSGIVSSDPGRRIR
jgi:hypothetical protein